MLVEYHIYLNISILPIRIKKHSETLNNFHPKMFKSLRIFVENFLNFYIWKWCQDKESRQGKDHIIVVRPGPQPSASAGLILAIQTWAVCKCCWPESFERGRPVFSSLYYNQRWNFCHFRFGWFLVLLSDLLHVSMFMFFFTQCFLTTVCWNIHVNSTSL